jgi:FkbM family methyltransferase
VIQGCHVRGEFYEQQELAIIEQHLPAGGVYLDVGANVGNHIVFVAKFCSPGEIIAVEPNVTALKFLEINLALNRIEATVLPFGLSDRSGRAEARWPNNNLGGAQLIPQPDGTVRVLAGDGPAPDQRARNPGRAAARFTQSTNCASSNPSSRMSR